MRRHYVADFRFQIPDYRILKSDIGSQRSGFGSFVAPQTERVLAMLDVVDSRVL